MAKDLEFIGGTNPNPKIWDHNNQKTDGRGGGYLASSPNVPVGKNLYIGTLINMDLSTKVVSVIKNALVLTGGTTTAPRVAKNHYFKVGEFGFVSGDAVTINSIDTSNTAYDVITFSAACTGATAGAIIEQATAAGATPTVLATANALLGEAVYNVQGGERVTPVFWVFELIEKSRFPVAISAAQLAALIAKGFLIV